MQVSNTSRPSLKAERLRLFQSVVAEFDRTGTWPSMASMERQLVQEMDVHEVLQGLGHPWLVNQTGEQKVELGVAALALCSGAEGLVDCFMRTLQFAASKYFGSDPNPELTQSMLVSELGLSNLRAHQALVLYKNENLWSSIVGHVPGNWIIKIDRSVRPFRGVSTLQEYVERRYGQDVAQNPLDGAQPAVHARSRTPAVPLVFLSHSGSRKAVAEVAQLLHDCFGSAIHTWSDADLPGGRWDDNIREKLGQAAALVLVGTPSVLSSVYAGYETGFVDERLGQRNVFVLRLGVDVSQLQSRPPLALFQSFDGTKEKGLRDFCVKLAHELGTLDTSLTTDFQAAAGQLRLAVQDEDGPGHLEAQDVQPLDRFQVALEDPRPWDIASKIVAAVFFGERGARIAGRTLPWLGGALLIAAFAALFVFRESAEFYVPRLQLLMFGGAGLLVGGLPISRAMNHRRRRRCKECHVNYAMEEVGTPLAYDLPLDSDGRESFERNTTRHYKCSNCGAEDQMEWSWRVRPNKV